MESGNKILKLAALTIIVILSILIGFYIFKFKQYTQGFSKIEIGQPKSEVIKLMGQPTSIHNCAFAILDENEKVICACSEMLIYKLPFEKWVFAIDTDSKVIEKVNVFLGEYGQGRECLETNY